MDTGQVTISLETSGRIGSAAIAAGGSLLEQRNFSAPMSHSREFLPVIKTLLDKHGVAPKDVNEVYISVGPGSFTGLRIAVTFAKIMYLANSKIRIAAVSTLDAIAQNVIEHAKNAALPDRFGCILDAKRGQFFTAVYQKSKTSESAVDGYEKIYGDTLMWAGEFVGRFAKSDNPVWLLGEGLVYYRDKFKCEGVRFFDESLWAPSASNICIIGRKLAAQGKYADPLTLVPAYIRKPELGKSKLQGEQVK
ncbi:MAG: tRNA (adenosine(37)-N6)-threonylcarbamoyltransferase complex dimerization subunit type 1 TsaB [Phycisphaerae bacterium]|nr:tRNA (adenosine(37)-N6)-threonylcarbamoyltransferase complex dimerization subunit type 1 TsaB [Phycisphaerae bacterium]